MIIRFEDFSKRKEAHIYTLFPPTLVIEPAASWKVKFCTSLIYFISSIFARILRCLLFFYFQVFPKIKDSIEVIILSLKFALIAILVFKIFHEWYLPWNFSFRVGLWYLSVLTWNMFEFGIFWSRRVHPSVCFMSENLSYVYCDEFSLCGHKCPDEIYVSLLLRYAEQSDISRARVQFFEGKRKIMLYTERSHFYHRYKVGSLECFVHWSCIWVLFYIGDTTLLSIVA